MPILIGPNQKANQQVVPLVTIREGVLFPHTEAVLSFGRPQSIAGVNAAFQNDRLICFVSQRNPQVDQPQQKDLYQIGTLASIERVLKSNDEVNALVKGMNRVRIEEIKAGRPFLLARLSHLQEKVKDGHRLQALRKHVANDFKKAVNLGKSVDFLVFMKLMSGVDPSELADQVASNLDLTTAEKQSILEVLDVSERLEKVSEALSHEIKVLEIERSIDTKTKKKFDQSMRKTVLKERMKTIQKELGESREDKDILELKKAIKKAKMPVDTEVKALKELKRLSQMHSYNPEAGYIRNYLDWLIELPWSKSSPNKVAISQAQKILDKDHYALDKVKERILEYLAVMQLKKSAKGRSNSGRKKPSSSKKAKASRVDTIRSERGTTILCFVGPPGVGKTSIGRSIAHALGREFVKMSLGGIRDEAEIRGHRRTYVGSMPGRIIQGIKNAKTNNPVFMLDEIDKVGTDFRGDPSSALLEALDPEQNWQFSDHYLEVPFDLSDVMFITTANIMDTIPPALKDRLEVIRFSGYTEDEKFNIAKKYLIDKTLKANGLNKKQLSLTDSALRVIIKNYTREAGVRNLEREIAKIFRKVARKITQKKKYKLAVSPTQLADYLGPKKYLESLAENC